MKNKPLPRLKHCEENVVHILNDYDRAIKMGYIVLNAPNSNTSEISIYNNEKYALLRSNKTPITKARKDPKNLWRTVTPEIFDVLVQVLYEHQDNEGNSTLTLWDNSGLYANDQAIFHSINHFYKNKSGYNYEKLEGQYRTFKAATTNPNHIIAGILDIIYQPAENILKTTEKYEYHVDGRVEAYTYNGFINFLGDADVPKQRLVWNDIDSRGVFLRQTHLTKLQGAAVTVMDGVMFYHFYDWNAYTRKIVIEDTIEGENTFTAHRDDKRIPERVKKGLTIPESFPSFNDTDFKQ